jgi:hypothetical protein
MDIYEDTTPGKELIKHNANNQTIYGTGVDTDGYEGVAFFAYAEKGFVGTFNLKAQEDTDPAYGSAADLAGSNVAFATAVATDGFAFVDIKSSAKRYVRPALIIPNLGTNNTVAVSVTHILYGNKGDEYARNNAADAELHVSDSEGAA